MLSCWTDQNLLSLTTPIYGAWILQVNLIQRKIQILVHRNSCSCRLLHQSHLEEPRTQKKTFWAPMWPRPPHRISTLAGPGVPTGQVTDAHPAAWKEMEVNRQINSMFQFDSVKKTKRYPGNPRRPSSGASAGVCVVCGCSKLWTSPLDKEGRTSAPLEGERKHPTVIRIQLKKSSNIY